MFLPQTTQSSPPGEQQEQQTTSSSDHLHPIACLACRKSHRKCDRSLPICKECYLKGRECVYPPPMKKGPQPKPSSLEDNQQASSSLEQQYSPSSSASSLDKSTTTTNHQQQQGSKPSSSSNINTTTTRHNPYHPPTSSSSLLNTTSTTTSSKSSLYSSSSSGNSNNQQQFVHTLNRSEPPLFNYQIVDLYFDIVSVGCPVLQRDAMMHICSKRPQENAKSEEVAMLFAIQALCYQRLGKKQEGRESFKLARTYLSDVFDILNNFHIAATFLYLANYCIGEGEPIQSKYYLNSVQFFMDQNKEILANDETFANLCKMFTYVSLLMSEEQIISADVGLQTNSSGGGGETIDLKKQLFLSEKALVIIYQFFVFFTQHMSDGECGKTIPQTSSSSSSPENMMQDFLLTVNKQATQFNRFQIESSPARSSVHKLLHLMIMDGLRLGIFAKSPNNDDEAILQTANRITNFTTLIYFPYLPSHVVTVVTNAARVHLAVLKQIQNGQRLDNGIDYNEIIKKDHRALTLLSDRYTIVDKKAKTLIKQLRDEIVERENQLANTYQLHALSSNVGTAANTTGTSGGVNNTQYSGVNLPNNIPNDLESTQRLEEIITNNPGVQTLPSLPHHINQETVAASPFLDFDFLNNSENFYTDPQILL